MNELTTNYLLNALTQVWIWNYNILTHICIWASLLFVYEQVFFFFYTNLATRGGKAHGQVYVTFQTTLLKIINF